MATLAERTHAPEEHQAGGVQVLRRSDHGELPQQHGGSGRAERLRQVEHHRRGALGDGRKLGEEPARRVDDRRHLQRLEYPQAGEPGEHRADLRQRRDHPGGRIRPVRRDIHSPAGLAGRAEHLFPQRHQVPAARHHRHLPRHRPGAAQLLDHRTGHDLQADRGASGRPAQLHRGSRGHFQVQGAPPRNRKPHPSDPGKPGTPHRPARRAGAATGTPAPAGPVGGKYQSTRPRSASSRPSWVPCAGAT